MQVPYIYGYIKELSEGVQRPSPMRDQEIIEMRNIEKRIDQVLEKIHEIDEELSEEENITEESDRESQS